MFSENFIMDLSRFSGRHFPPEVILWAVRWYCRYPLSYRHVEEMLKERGAHLDHATVARWVQIFGAELEKRLRRQHSKIGTSWRVDETYVKVKGEWSYLYRAVDKQGNTIDFLLSLKQDKQAAKRFFEKSIKKPANPKPEKVTTDKHIAYPFALEELKEEGTLPQTPEHRRSKYLNNRIESDHARFKQPLKPMRGFKSFACAENTIAGMEAMGMLRKRQFTEMHHYKTEVDFIHSLFELIA